MWLVDDASPDQTGAKVKAAFPEVHVIEGAGGLFWCKGMRLAWDKAIASGIKYDFYLWLNDDVMLKTDALADGSCCSAIRRATTFMTRFSFATATGASAWPRSAFATCLPVLSLTGMSSV